MAAVGLEASSRAVSSVAAWVVWLLSAALRLRPRPAPVPRRPGDGRGFLPRARSGRGIGGVERVVPVSVEAVPAHRQGVDLGVGDYDAGVVGVGVEFGLDPEPGACGGGCDGIHDDVVAGQRSAGQFMEMWENSWCSTLFHFDVPGGMWQTVNCRPVSPARAASSVFHARVR